MSQKMKSVKQNGAGDEKKKEEAEEKGRGEGGASRFLVFFPTVEVEGFSIPRFFQNDRPLQEQVQMLKALPMRPDDVIVMAYAKSGTHWIWEVVSMLLSGKAEYEKRTKVFAMMETTKIDDLNALPSPRVMNSHLPFRLLPRMLRDPDSEGKTKGKVIHVYRNVKDVFVSMYFHFSQHPEAAEMTFRDMEEMFFSEKAPTGNYFTYMKDMYEFRKNNPHVPIFALSYEDSKENPVKVIESLAQFLGVKASPQLIRDIAEETNFAKMRHAGKNDMKTHLPPAKIFRKGEVGDWKNYLTVAQSERLDAAMTQFRSCDYNFRYSL